MSQVSDIMRRSAGGYVHWCEACQEMHNLPDSWTFVNKDVHKPTFTPSFHQLANHLHGECHYIITDGIVNYCADCPHPFAGKSVPMASIPEELRDRYGWQDTVGSEGS